MLLYGVSGDISTFASLTPPIWMLKLFYAHFYKLNKLKLLTKYLHKKNFR